MARTLTDYATTQRYPTTWVVVIMALAAVMAVGFMLTSTKPSPSAPTKYEALDENFAP